MWQKLIVPLADVTCDPIFIEIYIIYFRTFLISMLSMIFSSGLLIFAGRSTVLTVNYRCPITIIGPLLTITRAMHAIKSQSNS